MKVLALIADTFREIYAKKVIIGIVVIQVLTLLLTWLILFSDGMQRQYKLARSGMISAGMSADSMQAIIEQSEPPTPLAAGDSSLLAGDSLLPFDSVFADSAPRHGRSAAFTATDSAKRTPGNTDEFVLDLSAAINDMVRGQMGAYAVIVTLAVVFLGIFATASIVPSMMEKGAVDLLLSKPLRRSTLLLGRTFGGLLAIAINLILFTTALWALYGLASGVWLMSFLVWTITIPLFSFVVIYSGVILLNVYTESWVLPMSLAYVHLMVLSLFLYSREETIYAFVGSPAIQTIVEWLYYILPQSQDMLHATSTAVYTGSIDSATPFIQGAIFSVTAISWAVWKFQRKNF